MDLLVMLLLLLLFNLLIPSSLGKLNGTCISQGGRFTPFSSDGKHPRKLAKGPRDLTLCRVFRKKTCCDVSQTHPALLAIRRLAVTGEASPECLHLWELLECSICDPHVGVKPGPPLLCASLCDRVFQACLTAYFSMDAKTQVLAPCGVNDLVCGRASEWVTNGTELCHVAGFAVKPTDNHDDTYCYGGKTSLESIADSWKASKPPHKSLMSGVLEDFEQWVREMPFRERVSWAVGGMVLTAGLLFLSKRKSYSQRQKQAAIQRNARKLELLMNQKSPVTVTRANRKSSGR